MHRTFTQLYTALLFMNLLLFMIISPVAGIFVVQSSNISVKFMGERVHGVIINRYISMNGTNVTVSGYTYNLNYTWHSLSNENVSFPAIWVQELYYRTYSLLPIRNETLKAIHDEQGENLIFASNYNGTHFSEAIIVGTGFSMVSPGDVDFAIYENGTYIYLSDAEPFIVLHEYNRSTIFANSTNSIYNPSYAIFKAVSFLNEYNVTFDNLTEVYLIPRKYLTGKFNSCDFVWTFKFYRDISNETTLMKQLYYFITAPNGTILEFKNMTLIGYIVGVPCEGCNYSPSNQSDSSLYFFLGILIVGTIATFVSIVFVYKKILMRRKQSM